MSRFVTILVFCFESLCCFSQHTQTHANAHAHNDYEHNRPLLDALQNGFTSVEADVHLTDGKLLVSHNHPGKGSSSLEKLYFAPLDSMLKSNSGKIYSGSTTPFYLMIDIKTKGESTYQAINQALLRHDALRCSADRCPVRVFISGNRPIDTIVKEYSGIAIDGRPDDLAKGYSIEMMPIVSDNFKNWSDWNGSLPPSSTDLQRVRELAARVHAEGKKLRLWAIPDNEITWGALLDAGVDLINTDRLPELNRFLAQKGL